MLSGVVEVTRKGDRGLTEEAALEEERSSRQSGSQAVICTIG